MINVRPARWPEDLQPLAGLETSLTTDRIFRVVRGPRLFELVETAVDPPMRKDYGPVTDDPGLRELDCAFIVEREGRAAGIGAGHYGAWNRRLVIQHLYVSPEHRGTGVGSALLEHLEAYARAAGARALWLETQNTNLPAIRFYERAGFRLCGLDDSLYDPAGPAASEVALFFTREVGSARVREVRG